MALFGQSCFSYASTSLATVQKGICDIKAPATSKSNLLEIALTCQGGVGGIAFVWLGRATTELFQVGAAKFASEENALDLSETTIATAWTVAPVAPVQTFRRHGQAGGGASASGFVWSFPRGLGIPPSGSLLLCHLSSQVNFDVNVWAEIDE